MKIILIDEYFHEREVDFKFLPEMGSILEVQLEQNHGRSKFRIESGGMRSVKGKNIPTLHLKFIGES